MSSTLFEKIWNNHIVYPNSKNIKAITTSLLYSTLRNTLFLLLLKINLIF